jgi:ParB/RepB/Spo0J family partition protein
MSTIRAFIRNISADDAFLASVAENLQRNADIDAFEEAKGYQALIENGWTQTRISEMIGKSDSYVSDRLNLIRRLHPKIATRLEVSRSGVAGQISASHAQRLARIKDPARQLELANLIEEAKLSVRDVENVLRKRSARGRFFIRVRRGGNVAIPPLLAERLHVEEGDILEARIRHGKLTFTVLHGSNLLRLCSKSDEESECEANSVPIGDF